MKKAKLFLVFLFTTFASASLAQQAGSLDTTFGVGGYVLPPFGMYEYSVVLQSDGKIITAGYPQDSIGNFLCIARFNTDGSLDTSFSLDGIDTLHISFIGSVRTGLEIQPDGKIVVSVGKIIRFNIDGSLDSTFGNGGISSFEGNGGVVLQTDGKIVVGYGIKLCRLFTDGSLDYSYGVNGFTTDQFYPPIAAGAGWPVIQPDGKIVTIGQYCDCSSICICDYLIERHDTDGSLDASFNGNGILIVDAYGNQLEAAWSVALQSNGDIIGVGYSLDVSAIVRASETGTVSGTLNFSLYWFTPGKVITQLDGKIITGGSYNGDFQLFRKNADLYDDTTFGSGGSVTTDFGLGGEGIQSMVIQPDGKLIAAGSVLARYNNCLVVMETNATCSGLCNGSVTVTSAYGTSPFTYAWSTGETTTSIDSLCPGNYSLLMNDAAGCTSTYNFSIGNFSVNINSTDVNCYGSCDGTATAQFINSGTPPYNYLWNTGDSTIGISNLCSGVYSVIVTDSNQCSDTATATIQQPSTAVTATSTFQNPSCTGCSNGSIAVNASGGNPPYTFTWVPVFGTRSGQSIINLPAGVYNVSVTDANGCSFAFSDTLTDPPNSIHDFVANNFFEISPNPTDGSFTLKNISSTKKTLLQILNPLGEIVYSQKLFGKNEYVVQCKLAAGIYFVKMSNADPTGGEEQNAVRKLVVE